MSRKILISGASGWIGSTLIRELINQSYKGSDIISLVLPNDKINIIENYNTHIEYADVRNHSQIDSIFNKYQITNVVHLASCISLSRWGYKKLYSVNVEGCKNLIQISTKYKVKNFIYISSIEAYPIKKSGKHIIHPDMTIDVKKTNGSPYARTKAQAHIEVLQACRENNFPGIIIAPAGVIGKYDYQHATMNNLVVKIAKGKGIPGIIDGSVGYVDVVSLCKAIIVAMGQKENNQKFGKSYILSSEESIAIEQYIEIIMKALNKKTKLPPKISRRMSYILAFFIEVISFIFRKQPILSKLAIDMTGQDITYVIDDAQKDLNFHQRDLHVIIEDTLKWFKEEKII